MSSADTTGETYPPRERESPVESDSPSCESCGSDEETTLSTSPAWSGNRRLCSDCRARFERVSGGVGW